MTALGAGFIAILLLAFGAPAFGQPRTETRPFSQAQEAEFTAGTGLIYALGAKTTGDLCFPDQDRDLKALLDEHIEFLGQVLIARAGYDAARVSAMRMEYAAKFSREASSLSDAQRRDACDAARPESEAVRLYRQLRSRPLDELRAELDTARKHEIKQ